MLDQRFSPRNFSKIFDRLNRRGQIDIASLPTAYQELCSEKRKVNDSIQEIRRKKLSERTEEETTRLEELFSRKKEIEKEKEALIEEYFETLEGEISNKGFSFNLTAHSHSSEPDKSVEEFSIGSQPECAYAMKQLHANLKACYNIEMASRGAILGCLKSIVNTKHPIFIIRTDIKGFFESIPQDRLLELIRRNTLLSSQSKRFVSQIIGEYEAKKDNVKVPAGIGIPRGVGISSILSEIYVQQLDNQLRSRPEVIFYGRYVDDIIIILASLGVFNRIDDYYSNLKAVVGEYGLTLHDKKANHKVQTITTNGLSYTDFEYLGYKLVISRQGREIKLTYRLGSKKCSLYEELIDSAFDCFQQCSQHNFMKARRDLLDRLNYITGNIKLNNSKGGIKAGIYYSNYLLDDLKDLQELNEHLYDKPISIPAHIIPDQKERDAAETHLKERIKKFDFVESWESRRICSLSHERIKELSSWL